MKTMYKVYLHRDASTGNVFYVGMGSNNRPYNFHARTKAWHAIRPSNITVEIVHEVETQKEALELEDALILHYRDKFKIANRFTSKEAAQHRGMLGGSVNAKSGHMSQLGKQYGGSATAIANLKRLTSTFSHQSNAGKKGGSKSKPSALHVFRVNNPVHRTYKCVKCGKISNKVTFTRFYKDCEHTLVDFKETIDL